MTKEGGISNRGLGAQIFGAVIVALLVGGTAPWWWHVLFGGQETPSLIKLGTINSQHPDYVELITSSVQSIDVVGYRICEHDPGEEKDSCYSIPPKSIVRAGAPLRVFFFSPKDSAKRIMAEEYRTQGKPVCDQFGIKAGEIVVLYGSDGVKVEEKKAR